MSAAASSFYVTIATQKGSTTKKVVGEVLSVGRADDCNLSISHETMSRRHLSVIVRNGECWVEDHGSVNGTFVNGHRVEAHAPVRVHPEDQVELAQSGIKLLVSAEPFVRPEGLPPLPNDEKTLVVKAPAKPLVVEKRTHAESQLKAETIVLEAYKKSSHLVHEAEIEAERRVEEIYRRAHEAQKKAETVYQERLNEAYRSAELEFSKAQGDAIQVLESARARSTEMRDLAERYVLELRQQAESECERILAAAQATARDLKENRLIEADEIARKKEEEIVKKATDAMNERLSKFEEDLFQQGVRRRAEVEEALQGERRNLEQINMDLQKKSALVSQLDEEILQKTMLADGLRREVDGLDSLRREHTSLEQLLTNEQARLEELRHETAQKIRAMEKELLSELDSKKDRLGREIALLLEGHLKQTPEGSEPNIRKFEAAVTKLVHAQLAVMEKDSGVLKRQKSLISLRRWDKFWSYFAGATIGAGLILAGQQVLKWDLSASPVDDKIAITLEKQKLDLERRKFTPPQTLEYKTSYVDNVVYTKNFVDLYLSDDFQDALLMELAPYMLKTWRIDEDKVIQLLSISTALAKNLSDRRDKIHPDFVNVSLEKMKALEAETQAKMVVLLGSQVRFESFKKFESQFYGRFLARSK